MFIKERFIMNKEYKVFFEIKNLGLYGVIPGLRNAMENEFARVYNMYADKTNGGITDKLNKEFEKLNPNYFKDNADKEWYDMTEYNQFMTDGYNRLIVDELNKTCGSPILDFVVEPEEVQFIGMLKQDHNVTIEMYLKEA